MLTRVKKPKIFEKRSSRMLKERKKNCPSLFKRLFFEGRSPLKKEKGADEKMRRGCAEKYTILL
jgi:hypothetical protein